MEYTEILYLIKQNKKYDDIGNLVINSEEKRKIYAKKKIVGSKEFYNAVAVGIKPTCELQIKAINYQNEEEAIYNNIRYSIIRIMPVSKTDIVIILGTKQGVKSD